MVTPQSLFEGTIIRQGCLKKSYRGSLHLTLKPTIYLEKDKESMTIVIVTRTYKNTTKSARGRVLST